MKQMHLAVSSTLTQRIFVIRGQKVMLDTELASLYGVKTQVLNQAVKRNRERLPSDFMFSLTREEILRISQIVISSNDYQALKYSKNVTVFTEHGVAMLSSVLHSPRAIQVNIQIMRAFAKLRETIHASKDLTRRLNELEMKYDGQFREVFAALRELQEPPQEPPRKIGFRPA